jgi:hypothetical protein
VNDIIFFLFAKMDVLIMKCKICGIMVFAGKEPKAYLAMNPNH